MSLDVTYVIKGTLGERLEDMSVHRCTVTAAPRDTINQILWDRQRNKSSILPFANTYRQALSFREREIYADEKHDSY